MNTQEIDDLETAVNQAYPPHDPDRRATTDGMDDDETMTNGQRAEEAASRLPFYYRHTDDESIFTDLICNLLHLAHSKGFDPASIARSALDSFHGEAGEMPETPTLAKP